MNRKDSFNKTNFKRKFSFNRPYSVKRSSNSRLLDKNIATLAMNAPPLVMTHPNNNSKKLKGMGNKFEREELYQINQQLKETVNSLKIELHDAKSQIVKKEREIKKKEKIIEDCYKEFENPSSLYQQSYNKAKESTLLSLFKERYNQLKTDYDKKLEEIEILKENIKITKLKEYQIDIDVLKKEMNKLRTLYENLFFENQMLKEEMSKLNEYKSKCNEQHQIINKCAKQVKDYNHNLYELELENEELQMKLYKNQKKEQKMKNQNSQLKITNEKYLRERKNRESFKMFNLDNINKIMKLEKELGEYKILLKQKDSELLQIKKSLSKQTNINININKEQIDNFSAIRYIEKNPAMVNEESNKVLLYKSLLEEKQKNYQILEKYLCTLNINAEQIIDEYNKNNYNNSINKSNANNSARLTQNNNNSAFNNINISSINRRTINNGNNGNNNGSSNDNNNLNNTNRNNENNNDNNDNNNDNNNSQLYNAAVINEQNNSDEQDRESYLFPQNENALNTSQNNHNGEEEKAN